MGIKTFKPRTPGTRFRQVSDFVEITKKTPEKSLTVGKRSTGGRNSYGRVTVTSRGGGHKRRLRQIDFKRNKLGISARVASIEYDPNRSARISLLVYADGEKRYILTPVGVNVGDIVESGPKAEHKIGNMLPLRNILEGSLVHSIELKPGKGAAMARAAGTFAQVMAKEGNYATLKLPSSEVRLVHLDCMATLGQVGNVDQENRSLGKAGINRWLGKRPHTRGVAKNPVDHPMGGGEGKSSGGRHPCTPWGKPTKGYRTRKNKRTQNMIIRRRTKK